MSYFRVPGDKYLVDAKRGPRRDSVRLAIGVAVGLIVVVIASALAIAFLSNRGATPTPPPFRFTSNSTIVDAVFTNVDTALPPFQDNTSSSSTGAAFNDTTSSTGTN